MINSKTMLEFLALLSKASDPIALMQQRFGNNPMFQQAANMLNGKSPADMKQFVINAAQSQGVDIQNLQNLAKQFNIPL